jgi:hypothetical protein
VIVLKTGIAMGNTINNISGKTLAKLTGCLVGLGLVAHLAPERANAAVIHYTGKVNQAAGQVASLTPVSSTGALLTTAAASNARVEGPSWAELQPAHEDAGFSLCGTSGLKAAKTTSRIVSPVGAFSSFDWSGLTLDVTTGYGSLQTRDTLPTFIAGR